MGSRTYRLSISPESSADVKRVLELDGRASLHDLHAEIGKAFGLPPSGAVYAFFLSGRFWDASTAYVDPRAEGQRANKALLFRLGLTPNKTFAYLLGFEVERHFLVQVVSVTEAERALPEPRLVESVGDAPPELALTEKAADDAESAEDVPPEELAAVAPLAEEFLDADDELEPYENELATARLLDAPWDDGPPELGNLERFRARPEAPDLEPLREVVGLFRTAQASALRLAQALDGNVQRFLALDDWLIERGLGPRLLDFPLSLSIVGEHDAALELGRALSFIDPDLMNGDLAIILAKAGQREQALARVAQNLEEARDKALAESKAGDAYRALGDLPAAEAYYRRSLVESKSASDRLNALLRLIGCLTDSGRDAEANELLQEARKARGEPERVVGLGRNDPCPCGSGKKYKKCHGT